MLDRQLGSKILDKVNASGLVVLNFDGTEYSTDSGFLVGLSGHNQKMRRKGVTSVNFIGAFNAVLSKVVDLADPTTHKMVVRIFNGNIRIDLSGLYDTIEAAESVCEANGKKVIYSCELDKIMPI